MRFAGGIALLVLLACGCSSSPGPGRTDGGAGVGGVGGGSGGSPGGHGGAVKPPDGGTTDARPGSDASCSNANRDNGLACSCSAQCKSKFCVEGYCCNSACQGTCETCAQAMSLGTCTMVAAGVKPTNPGDCHVEASTTCGKDGTCDGKGGCRLYSVGTVCTAGTCQGAEIGGTRVCDGAGACRAGAINVCAPFLCSTTTNQCKTTCTGDGDCVSPVKCLGGSCGPKALGAHCGGDSECDSKHCADGVCCNTACGGACQSCNQVASPGTCTPTPAGQPHALCPKQDPTTCGTTGMCDGQGGCPLYPLNTACGQAVCVDANSGKSTRTCDGLGTCLTAKAFSCGNFACTGGACTEYCSSQADCAPGHTCTVPTGGTVGTCGKKVDGQTCAADADCVNGHCADGVCCDTTCTGACRSCAVPGSLGTCTSIAAGGADPHGVCKDLTAAMCSTDGKCDGAGACRKYPTGTICAPEGCSGSSYTAQWTCSSSGTCTKPSVTTCSPYQCNGTACYTACSTDSQCVSPNTCGMNGVAGSCGTKPNGQPCSNNNQCSSGQCAQGVCCGTSCGTACHACNIAGSLGTCVGITASSDPQGMCGLQDQSTCGTTGQCVSGQCAKWPSGTQCKAATCSNGNPTTTLTPAAKCDGAGNCATSATMSCPGICANGGCGFQVQGGVCGATSQCASGLTCVSGICCNTACTGACSSCNLAGKVGTCSPIAAGTVCRAANGTCDVAETCGGTSLDCPADGVASSSTVCRAAAGNCDVAEKCDGTSKSCPADALAPSSTVCRAAASTCDVAEKCTGTSVNCPTDTFAPSSTVCRAATSTCDVAENCTGTSSTCPTDTFASSSTVCRAAVSTCDVAEKCTGSSSACPTDTFASSSTVCRAAVSTCDVAEKCTGSSSACPADAFASSSTVCRASTGVCDPAESCSGSSSSCPADAFAPSTTVCRAQNGVCDVAENCTGTSGACPTDGFLSSSTVCRAATGTCDVAEKCTGASGSCPADVLVSAGTVCRSSAGACDVAESCSGSSGSCPADVLVGAGTVCRSSAGVCDVAEACTGTAAACPADAFATTGVCSNAVCNADNSLTFASSCNGQSATCPVPVTTPCAVCDASVPLCI